MCKWGREEGSAAGSFPFKCGSAHMEPHCAAPRMRGPSAGPGRASSAARPGTKGGGAATPSPSDTPVTPRSPRPPARPQHPGRVRPPARSPTPPPPRPSRPLAPGGPPRPSPRVPPQRSHPLPRPHPLLPGHVPPAGACGAPAASPDNKGAGGLPLPGTGGEGEPARGGGTRAPQVPSGRAASAGSQPGPGVPRSGGGGTILLPPLLSGASETPPNISPHTTPALRDELRLRSPPAPGRRDRKGRGRGVLQPWYRGAGGCRQARPVPPRAPPAGRGQPRGRSSTVPAPLPSPGSPGSNRRSGSPSPARPSSLGSRLGTARRGGAVISPSPSHTHALPPAPSPSRRPFLPPLRAAAPPRPPGRCSPAADHPPPSLPSSAAGPGTC